MKQVDTGEGLSKQGKRLPLSAWSRYSETEMAARSKIIKEQIYLDSLAHRKTPESGSVAEVTAKAFAYALEDIPTSHLEACFTRAIRAQTDNFPLGAAAVVRQWEGLGQELLRNPPEPDVLALPVARSGYLSLVDWKAKHNLPEAWQLGQPYPPESDLYNRPVPGELAHEQPRYSCHRCLDAGWTRIPYDARTLRPAKIIRCSCVE